MTSLSVSPIESDGARASSRARGSPSVVRQGAVTWDAHARRKPLSCTAMTSAPPVSPERRAEAQRALKLTDEQLLAECAEEFFIASGPGGQHRNTTESGVRLTHARTELTVTATERRSQLQNRGVALERLKEGLRALTFVPKKRRPTRPTRGSQKRRLESKAHHAKKKQDRRGWD